MGFNARSLKLALNIRLWQKSGLYFLLQHPATTSKHIRFIITYWELAGDLKTGVNNKRIALLKDIITALNLPYDNFLLLPSTNFSHLSNKLDVFFCHTDKNITHTVICFGKKALQMIYKTEAKEYGRYRDNHHDIFYLPSLNKMLPDNRELKKITWNILKQFISKKMT